jgi:hypothetical protein
MPSQTGKNVIIGVKVESTFNTAPSPATGGLQLRLNPSPGMALSKALINSGEVRSDLLSSIARHGSRKADGSYSAELSVGSFDVLFEAVMRSTWVAANVITVDGTAPNVSFTVNSTSQFTYVGTTTLLTKGLRAGDVVRFANMSTTANNSINVRIKSIDAAGLVVNVFGTPLTIQTADSAATLTILKKVKNGATAVKRTFYIDEYYQDVDLSEVYGGCRFISMKITGSPDGMATVDFGVLGASGTALVNGTSPFYTSPTQFTSIPLVFADASIDYNGTDIANATAFELTYVIAASTQGIIGSSITPDVFDNNATLSGSISIVRQDLAALTALSAETEMALHVLLVEPMSEPKNCISIYVPRLKLSGANNQVGQDSAMIDTLPWVAGVPASTATDTDASLLTITTSAA